MAQDITSGPGGSVADIQPETQTDNLGDADTLADWRNADPDLIDRRDDMTSDNITDTPIEDEQQLVSDSTAIDVGGTNDSDLGAEQAGLTEGYKGSDAGLDISSGTSDRATGLGAFRD